MALKKRTEKINWTKRDGKGHVSREKYIPEGDSAQRWVRALWHVKNFMMIILGPVLHKNDDKLQKQGTWEGSGGLAWAFKNGVRETDHGWTAFK